LRKISSEFLSDSLLLLTMAEVVDGSALMAADFRDTHALFHSGTGRFIGLSRDRGIRFGSPPVRMENGIWVLEEDPELAETVKDVRISASDLTLKAIS